jgi:hypothetical protein
LLIGTLYVIVIAVLMPFLLSLAKETEENQALFFSLWDFFVGLLFPTVFPSGLGLILPITLSLGFQLLMNRLVFFVGWGKQGNAWLRFPFWYAIFDYNLIYTNALIGVMVCVGRLAMLFCAFVAFLARLDKTTMPGPTGNFINFDPGYKAYVAMLRMEHRYNNPIFLVFGSLMTESLEACRIRQRLRNVRRMLIKAAFAHKKARGRLRLWALSIVERAQDVERRRLMTVRNRWQLLWRMMQQPYLKDFRGHSLFRERLKQKLIKDTAASSTSLPVRDYSPPAAAPPAVVPIVAAAAAAGAVPAVAPAETAVDKAKRLRAAADEAVRVAKQAEADAGIEAPGETYPSYMTT